MRRVQNLAIAGLVLVFTAAHAEGPLSSPLAEIQRTIDSVLVVVNDATLLAPGREEARREAVLRVIEQRFDFHETAQS